LSFELGAEFHKLIMKGFNGESDYGFNEVDRAIKDKIFKTPDATYPSIKSASSTGIVIIRFDRKMRIG